MSGTGLPILMSRNCVRARQNASSLLSRKGKVKLTCHDHYLQQRQCFGFMFTSLSHNYSILSKPLSAGTWQNPLELLRGYCAIKVQKNCPLSCCNKLSSNLSSLSFPPSLHEHRVLTGKHCFSLYQTVFKYLPLWVLRIKIRVLFR